MPEPSIEIGFPEAARAEIVALLRAYEAGLGIRLEFQDFSAELAALPGAYAPPDGAFLVAWQEGGDVRGCVALRPFDRPAAIAEMKRLFVAEAARGTGLGRRLALAVTGEARRLGYRRLRLDTLPSMQAAQRLYRDLGFVPIDNYNGNPVAGSAFLELDLTTLPEDHR